MVFGVYAIVYGIDIDKKGSDHPFQHSRTTLKNGPPLGSLFWNSSNLVLERKKVNVPELFLPYGRNSSNTLTFLVNSAKAVHGRQGLD